MGRGDPGGVTRAVLLISAVAALSVIASASGDTGKFAAWIAYSHCMRAHGLVSYPDPKQTADGGVEIPGYGRGVDSPVYLSAQHACSRLLPGGEPSLAKRQQEVAKMLVVSRCMRAHGVVGFPDPTLSEPSDRGAYSDVMSNGYVWFAIPNSTDVRSPSFTRAAAACKLVLS
jgi:hypothetical protein